MINAKQAHRKANKAQRKKFKENFRLLKFSVKEHSRMGDNSCSMNLSYFGQTEEEAKIVIEYFEKKGFVVDIKNCYSYTGLKKEIIIYW